MNQTRGPGRPAKTWTGKMRVSLEHMLTVERRAPPGRDDHPLIIRILTALRYLDRRRRRRG